MARQVYADNVDANGKVFETVGENIRKGARAGELLNYEEIMEKLDALDPEIASMQVDIMNNKKEITRNIEFSFISAGFLNNIGNLIYDTIHLTSDFISVSGWVICDGFFIGAKVCNYMACYDGNKKFLGSLVKPISDGGKVRAGTVKLLDNTKYIRIFTHKAHIKDISLRYYLLDTHDMFNIEQKIDGIKELSLKWKSGKYVAFNGTVIELTGYAITDPVTLPPKTKIIFNGMGYEKNVAMISEYNGVKYNPLVISDSSDLKDYEYTTDKTITVVFSGTNIENSNVKFSINQLDALNELNNDINKLNETISLSLFSKFGIVGDSFASGEVSNESGVLKDNYSGSWGQILARKLGTTCVNFSEGGLTTRTWQTSTKGLTLLKSTEKQQVYYLALGINDIYSGGTSYLGVESDIESGADTFYGNYGKIINEIKSYSPNSKIIMFTTAFEGETENAYNEAIIKIANHYKLPYVVQLDDEFFKSAFYLKNMVSNHPIAIVYSGMANAFERLIQKCVIDNIEYFKYLPE